MKHISEAHDSTKGISAKTIFKTSFGGNVTAIQLLQNETLKEHSSKTDALLVCVQGSAVYKDEENIEEQLYPGNYVEIKAGVKHWLESPTDNSQLILIK